MKTEILKLTSAIVVSGRVLRPGELVEVSASEAAGLLHRGKAVRAAAEASEAEPVEPVIEDAPLHPDVEDANATAAVEDAEDAAAEASEAPRRSRKRRGR